jgi:hypothetical protein
LFSLSGLSRLSGSSGLFGLSGFTHHPLLITVPTTPYVSRILKGLPQSSNLKRRFPSPITSNVIFPPLLDPSVENQ